MEVASAYDIGANYNGQPRAKKAMLVEAEVPNDRMHPIT